MRWRALAAVDLALDAVEAGDGHELLARLDEQAFDLALVDLLMPGMDGVNGVRALRQRCPRCP